MKRRLMVLCVIVALVVTAMAGCSSSGGPAPAPEKLLVIASSTAGSSSYMWVAGVVKILNKYTNLKWSERSSLTTTNILLVEAGEVDAAAGQSSAYREAKGVGKESESKLRQIAYMYNNPYFSMVKKDSLWKTYRDIPNGARWMFNTKAGTVRPVMEKVIEIMGKKVSDYTALYMSSTAGAEAWREGSLDVFSYAGGVPAAALLNMGTSKYSFKMLDYGQDFNKLVEAMKPLGYYAAKLPKGVMAEFDQDYNILGSGYTLFVKDTFPEDIAYQMAKAIFEHQKELIEISPSATETTPENTILMAKDDPAFPIHPGAIKYLKEKGLLK